MASRDRENFGMSVLFKTQSHLLHRGNLNLYRLLILPVLAWVGSPQTVLHSASFRSHQTPSLITNSTTEDMHFQHNTRTTISSGCFLTHLLLLLSGQTLPPSILYFLIRASHQRFYTLISVCCLHQVYGSRSWPINRC